MVNYKICGPKLSICGVLISIWGVLQVSIMSLAFYFRSVALVEDVPVANETTYTDFASYSKAIDDGYGDVAFSCMICALLYVVTLGVSAHQVWVNTRSSVSTRNNYANFQNER